MKPEIIFDEGYPMCSEHGTELNHEKGYDYTCPVCGYWFTIEPPKKYQSNDKYLREGL